MGTAVDHVQHRHGQHARALAADEAPEWLARVVRSRLRGGERDAEDRVGAEPALVRGAVELDQASVERPLIGGVEPADARGDLAVDVRDRPRDRLPGVRVAAVAQLDGLVHARRGARRHRRPAARAGLELDVDLDRGIAARVEDLARAHRRDGGHSVSLARSK
jgi:hypothetical protein